MNIRLSPSTAADDHATTVDRRGLLKMLGSGFALSVGATGLVSRAIAADAPKKYGRDSMPGGVVDNPLAFVSISTDGTVTIVAHRVEMGTGSRTSLPMVVADEMEADWSRVKIVQAIADETKYGNQNVDGSRSMRHFFEPMRRVGASARQMLEAAAAAHWGVAVSEVKAVKHQVLHVASGKRLGYGELAEAAMKQPVPTADALKLKAPKDFRYIGKGKVLPVDGRAIANGQATYGADVRLPDMVYAVIARPPVYGGRLVSVDSADALRVPGVVKVIEVPSVDGAPNFNQLGGVAVVAKSTWAALRGRAALKIQWKDGPNAGYNSVEFKKELQASARKSGNPVRNTGDAVAAIAAAPSDLRVESEYYLPHLAHASMEPPVATVQIKDGRAECWAPVQNPALAVAMAAAGAGLKPDQVTVHPTLLGGAFGRKSKPDFVAEAAFLSKAMEGRAVKVQWTREDDLHHDYFHYVSVQHMEGALGADGKVKAWLHRTVEPTIITTFAAGVKSVGNFEYGMTAITVPWDVPNVRLEVGEADAHTRMGWFRSVANIPHAFAAQSFMDELAHKAGRDPKQFLLEMIGPDRKIAPAAVSDDWNYTEDPAVYPIDAGRFRRVVEEATRRAGWGKKLPKGRGLGLAVAHSFMSYVAAVIEVEVSPSGELSIPRVDVAIDCGPAVNPERVRSQVEGGVIMGLGVAMLNEITFNNGRVEQNNFDGYVVPRNFQSPKQIQVWLVNPEDFSVPPGGVGEPPVPPIAPALCNAIFAATGKRIRSLPIGSQLSA